MEGVPITNTENVESLDKWKGLREEAPNKARALINEIPDFEARNLTEKISEVEKLIDSICPNKQNPNNDDRYVVRELCRILEILKVQSRLARLEIAA